MLVCAVTETLAAETSPADVRLTAPLVEVIDAAFFAVIGPLASKLSCDEIVTPPLVEVTDARASAPVVVTETSPLEEIGEVICIFVPDDSVTVPPEAVTSPSRLIEVLAERFTD